MHEEYAEQVLGGTGQARLAAQLGRPRSYRDNSVKLLCAVEVSRENKAQVALIGHSHRRTQRVKDRISKTISAHPWRTRGANRKVCRAG
jgi:hypothetical protein